MPKKAVETLITYGSGFGEHSTARSLAASPDGKLIAVGANRTLQKKSLSVWNLATGERVATLKDASAPFDFEQAVTFSPDGKFLTADTHRDTSGVVRLWDTATWRIVRRFRPKDAVGASGFAFSPDSRLLATSQDSSGGGQRPTRSAIYLWDMKTGELKTTFDVDENATKDLVFSDDGTHIACCSGGGVYVWDVSTFHKNVIRATNRYWFFSPKFSPDGQSLMVIGGNNLYVLDIRTGQEKRRLHLARNVHSVAYLPDSKCMAVEFGLAGDSSIIIYDYRVGRELMTFAHRNRKPSLYPCGSDSVSDIEASASGNFIYRVRNGRLSIWDIDGPARGTKL